MPPRTTGTFHTFSSEETKQLGHDVARSLTRGPAAIALKGDLGAGKTTFVQGFLKGLGSNKRVTSPTFVLMRRHSLRARKDASKKTPFSDIFHIDAYRLRKPEHLSALGLDVILSSPKNVVLIEWPEQAKRFLPKDAIWITFKYGKKENERIIVIPRKERT